jgi:hypothetical protein
LRMPRRSKPAQTDGGRTLLNPLPAQRKAATFAETLDLFAITLDLNSGCHNETANALRQLVICISSLGIGLVSGFSDVVQATDGMTLCIAFGVLSYSDKW